MGMETVDTLEIAHVCITWFVRGHEWRETRETNETDLS